jgi:hypothetical protein
MFATERAQNRSAYSIVAEAVGSIAMTERFWRTLKEMLRLKVRPPLTALALFRRLETGLHYYAYLKPHQGLGGHSAFSSIASRSPGRLSEIGLPKSKKALHRRHEIQVIIVIGGSDAAPVGFGLEIGFEVIVHRRL